MDTGKSHVSLMVFELIEAGRAASHRSSLTHCNFLTSCASHFTKIKKCEACTVAGKGNIEDNLAMRMISKYKNLK